MIDGVTSSSLRLARQVEGLIDDHVKGVDAAFRVCARNALGVIITISIVAIVLMERTVIGFVVTCTTDGDVVVTLERSLTAHLPVQQSGPAERGLRRLISLQKLHLAGLYNCGSYGAGNG